MFYVENTLKLSKVYIKKRYLYTLFKKKIELFLQRCINGFYSNTNNKGICELFLSLRIKDIFETLEGSGVFYKQNINSFYPKLTVRVFFFLYLL